MTKFDRQWIHADAGYYHDPLALKIKGRFGWAGVVFFDAFLRGCKRTVPQGRVVYTSDEELVHFLGVADLVLVTCAGDAWTISELWRFLGRQRPPVVTSRRVHGRVMTISCAWDAWEMSATSAFGAERKRRWRAQKRDADATPPRRNATQEVGGWRGEVGEGSVRGENGLSPASPQGAESRPQKTNGLGRPDPGVLVALVDTLETKNGTNP